MIVENRDRKKEYTCTIILTIVGLILLKLLGF